LSDIDMSYLTPSAEGEAAGTHHKMRQCVFTLIDEATVKQALAEVEGETVA